MKICTFITYVLLALLMAVQASYIALAEGFLFWLIQNFSGIVITDFGYWTLVLICFVPNYVYTCIKTYQAFKKC